jgi:hypothetical protein
LETLNASLSDFVASLSMTEKKVPFFASSKGPSSSSTPAAAELSTPAAPEKTLEEEVEEMTKGEVEKMKRQSNLRNANGVDYAPWMKISEQDETKIKQMMLEKQAARRKRQEQEKTVSGALLVDSQAQELSGGGLRSKVLSNTEIELEWATNSEVSTKGFLIKRRPARTEEFEVIASYVDWGPLASKGPEGGQYRFLDDGVSPGGWVYRVTECETNGSENDICQALVEVQTKEEQKGAIIGVVAFVVVAIAAVAAGIVLDPVDGY